MFIIPLSAVDAAIKMRPREDELEELGPDFAQRWKEFYANKPDKPLFWLSALAGYSSVSVDRFESVDFTTASPRTSLLFPH